MQTLKLAVIGAGHLGRIHARLATNLSGAKLVAVVDPMQRSRDELAAEVGADSLADYSELVGRVDAAIIATPTRTHHAVGMHLLSHGIHCLVEKPIAADLSEAEALCRTAQQHRAVLQVGHVERFNPALARALPYLRQPKYIQATRTSGYAFRSTDIGVVLDLMIHDLDVVLSLVRSPVRTVEALGVSVLGQHEDLAQARVTFEDGCIADFTASRVSYQSQRAMQVYTSQAFVALDFGSRTTDLVRPSAKLMRREFDLDSLSPESKEHLKNHFFEELLVRETDTAMPGNAIAEEQADFVESIATGRSPRVSGQHGREALAVAEQILKSIELHCWDGHDAGRQGPFLRPAAAPTLRGPHFPLTPGAWEQRPQRQVSPS